MMCLALAIGSLGLGAMHVAYRRAATRQVGKWAGPFDDLYPFVTASTLASAAIDATVRNIAHGRRARR